MPHTAGCRSLASLDIPTVVLYPADAEEREARLDRFTVPVAMDAPPAEGRFPLVVVSHGTGSSALLFRGLAAHLAREGFVVALPEHPGNNRADNALAGTARLLEERPRHVTRVIDAALADPVLGSHLLADRVAVVGHSLGGYTALALAGGRPMTGPYDAPVGPPRPVPVTPDPRLRALVLLAPATPWYLAPGALDDVRLPILMLTGDRDPHTPPFHGQILRDRLPDPSRLEHHVVPDAGHFSFFSPFPPPLVRPDFPPSQDPPGFDRAAFQPRLHAQVTAFLRRNLAPSDDHA